MRDSARTIRAAASSILRQTERDLALVCVDDGSRDGTLAALEALAARDRRVIVVRGPGEGIPAALNRGLARCDAPLVARMDADDVAHPERLALQRALLEAEPAVAAAGTRIRLFPRAAVRGGMARYAAWLNGLVSPALVRRDLFVEAPLVHPSAMIRRAPLEAGGGWSCGDFPEDYELWLRLAAEGHALTNLPRTLLAWRESPGRATRQDPRYALDRHLALKARFLARGPLAGRREVAVWGAGASGKALCDALAPEGIRPALFVEVDAKKIGRTIRGAPVVGYRDVVRARGLPLLVAVGAPAARELIRTELASAGFLETRDFWCTA